jgi:prepilin-type N-terminal cleavage/methylation domain-containing protein
MKGNKAFTLAELLVALALTSGLAVLLMTMVSGAMNVWRQGRNQVDTFSSARQAFGRMADELTGAIASSGRIEFSENLAALNSDSQSVAAPIATTSENIFFMAPYPNSAAGDLCAIAYRLDSTNHLLQRAFVDSQTAWSAGASTRYRAAGYSSNLQWRTVTQGVLEFEVRSYSQQDLDTNAPPASTWNSETGVGAMTGNVPRRIVLRLRVTDDKSLARLNAVPATGAAHDRIVAQSAREFTADLTLLPLH